MIKQHHLILILIVISLLAPISVQARSGSPNPNTAGYSFIDSNSVGGPVHGAFTDISGSGTPLSITDSDYANVTLPFPYTFFGVTINQARISVKGHVLFNTTSSAIHPIWEPKAMPFSDWNWYTPLGAFPLWDNFITGSTGTVYYATLGSAPNRQFVVQWHNIVHANAPTASAATFNLVITEGSNNILFQYRDTDYGDFRRNGAYAAVGVEKDGITGYLYSFQQAILSDGLNILFVGPEMPDPPTVDQYATPSTINVNNTTTLVYSIANGNTSTTLTGVQFDNTLPAGLAISDPLTVTTTNCGTPTFDPVLTAGGSSINLRGAAIDPGTSCTISIQLTGISAGQHTNTFASVTTNETTPQTSIPDATVTVGSGGSSTNSPTAPTTPATTAPSFPAPPPVPLCANMDGSTSESVRADVPGGIVTEGSAFCRTISNATEIGNTEVINQGIINAVDIFGMTWTGNTANTFNDSMMVCLQGMGSIIYLDAAQSPRIPQAMPATSSGGYTCASVPGAGMLVLVNGPAAPASTAPQATAPAAETALNGCRVTTTHAVRLRTEPNTTTSTVITTLPYDITLDATARSGGWLRVIYQNGQGWVSADYLNTSGACG